MDIVEMLEQKGHSFPEVGAFGMSMPEKLRNLVMPKGTMEIHLNVLEGANIEVSNLINNFDAGLKRLEKKHSSLPKELKSKVESLFQEIKRGFKNGVIPVPSMIAYYDAVNAEGTQMDMRQHFDSFLQQLRRTSKQFAEVPLVHG